LCPFALAINRSDEALVIELVEDGRHASPPRSVHQHTKLFGATTNEMQEIMTIQIVVVKFRLQSEFWLEERISARANHRPPTITASINHRTIIVHQQPGSHL